jgi:hypothetical protein
VIAEVVVGLAAVLIVAGGVLVTRWVGSDDRVARLADRFTGTAVVESVDWRDGEAMMALRVTLGRRRPYGVQVSQRLDPRQVAGLHVGSTVNVLIDPSDRQRVELDFG